jgi:putative ABC transport system ATP-binding protein
MTLAGLERPDKGSVLIAGTNITQMSEDRLARFRGEHIGIVFQSFLLIPTMNALENVAIPLELAGKDEPFQRALEALDSVGLSERLTHFPKQLSGGEQQRVAIARALCMNPLILAADEPTGNLDSETGLSIADLIFMQQKIHKTTLILATHDESLAARCSRRIRLKSGSIISDTQS